MMRLIKGKDFKLDGIKGLDSVVVEKVRGIIEDVRTRGDEAVKDYTLRFDRVSLRDLRVDKESIRSAGKDVDEGLKESIKLAIENLTIFSRRQMEVFSSLNQISVEVKEGVVITQRVIPLDRVGIYVPGGRYPLVSSLIMAAVPAIVAGVKEIAVCSPPDRGGNVSHVILYTASVLGIDEIYSIGGAQGVAALALGTESIRQVDKIVGPGNIYVATAKRELFGEVGIDFIAGPTEVLIIADGEANPEYIASDLLAQAEHDVMARPVLITDNIRLVESVLKELERQLSVLETRDVAERSLKEQGVIIFVDNLEEGIDIANTIAPEHLELHVKNTRYFVERLTNFGTLFVGEYSIEALGDYSAGVNHILPTNRSARYTGGLSVKDFLKFNTMLTATSEGLRHIGISAINLAEAEGLKGHASSIRKRIRNM